MTASGDDGGFPGCGSTAPSTTILVFARAPQLGRVKTRLAAELGDESALTIYRDLGLRAYHAARAVAAAAVVVVCTPADAADEIVSWLGNGTVIVPQCDGDLGDRMRVAAADAFTNGARRVILIGTDCPDLSTATLHDAITRLAEADVVLGPATDGGYYLIGMSRSVPELFTGIPWSTAHTLGATLAAASRAGLRATLLDELADVDTADDWHLWRESSVRTQHSGASRPSRAH